MDLGLVLSTNKTLELFQGIRILDFDLTGVLTLHSQPQFLSLQRLRRHFINLCLRIILLYVYYTLRHFGRYIDLLFRQRRRVSLLLHNRLKELCRYLDLFLLLDANRLLAFDFYL